MKKISSTVLAVILSIGILLLGIPYFPAFSESEPQHWVIENTKTGDKGGQAEQAATPVSGYDKTWNINVPNGYTGGYKTKLEDLENTEIKVQLPGIDYTANAFRFHIGFTLDENLPADYRSNFTDNPHKTYDILWINNTFTGIYASFSGPNSDFAQEPDYKVNIALAANSTFKSDDGIIISFVYAQNSKTGESHWYLSIGGQILNSANRVNNTADQYFQFDEYIENGAYFYIYNITSSRSYDVSFKTYPKEWNIKNTTNGKRGGQGAKAATPVSGYDETWNINIPKGYTGGYKTKFEDLENTEIKVQIPGLDYLSTAYQFHFGFTLDENLPADYRSNFTDNPHKTFDILWINNTFTGIYAVFSGLNSDFPSQDKNNYLLNMALASSNAIKNNDGFDISFVYARNSKTGESHWYLSVCGQILNSATDRINSTADEYFQFDEYVENGAYFYIYNLTNAGDFNVSFKTNQPEPPVEEPQDWVIENTTNGVKGGQASKADTPIRGYDTTWNLNIPKGYTGGYKTKIEDFENIKIKVQIPGLDYLSAAYQLHLGFTLDEDLPVNYKSNFSTDPHKTFDIFWINNAYTGIYAVFSELNSDFPSQEKTSLMLNMALVPSSWINNNEGITLSFVYALNPNTGEKHWYLCIEDKILNSATDRVNNNADEYFQFDEYVEKGAYFYIYNLTNASGDYVVSYKKGKEENLEINGWEFGKKREYAGTPNNAVNKGAELKEGFRTFDVTVAPGFSAVYTTKITDLDKATIRVAQAGGFDKNKSMVFGFSLDPVPRATNDNPKVDPFKSYFMYQNPGIDNTVGLNLFMGQSIDGKTHPTAVLDYLPTPIASAGYILTFSNENGHWYLNISGTTLNGSKVAGAGPELEEFLRLDEFVEKGGYFFIYNWNDSEETFRISIKSEAVEPDEISDEPAEPWEEFLDLFRSNLEGIRNNNSEVLARLKASWDALDYSGQIAVETELVNNDELWNLLEKVKNYSSSGESPDTGEDDTGNGENDKGKNPNTGDSNRVIFPIFIASCSLFGAVIAVRRRRYVRRTM